MAAPSSSLPGFGASGEQNGATLWLRPNVAARAKASGPPAVLSEGHLPRSG